MDQEQLDDILGITRCVQCGHRLDGDIECPFCAIVYKQQERKKIPTWVFLMACFLTSPLSLYAVVKTERLTATEKFLAFSGCLIWLFLFRLWF